jgi:hypothetical protein
MIDYKEITLGDTEQLENCYCDGDSKTIRKEEE